MAGQKTITQRIAFEGGPEMELQLKRLGDAGQLAFTRIKTAADNASGFGARMAAAVEIIRARLNGLADAAGNVGERFTVLRERTTRVGERMLLASASVAALATGFTLLIKDVAKTTEELENNAAAAGLSVEKYQNLANAFDIAGIGNEKFGTLMNRLNKTMGEGIKNDIDLGKAQAELGRQFSLGKISAEGYAEQLRELQRKDDNQTNIFTRLGLSARQFNNDTEAALKGVIEKLGELPKGIERSALEFEILGRSGSVVDALVDKGVEGINELVKESQRIAPALTKTQLAVGQTLDDAFDKVRLAAKNTQQQFFLTFGPVMTTLVDGVGEAIIRLRPSIIQFAETLVGTIRPAITDIVKLLNGETINPNGLVGRIVEGVKQFAADAKQAIGIVVAAWEGFVSILDVIAKAINAVFGTNFTGQALAIVAVIGVVTGAFSALAALVTTIISIVGVFDAVLVLAFGPEGALLVGLALLGAAIGALLVQIPSVGAAFQALIDGFNGTVQNFKNLFGIIGGEWQLLWRSMVSFVSGPVDTILGYVQTIIDKIKSAASSFAGFFGGGGDSGKTTNGFATGGKVNGPGTSRSDSILARLSNGEFVHQAPAVAFYGERFMHALNRMQIPKSFFDGLTGFANGGLVQSVTSTIPIPGFASGGLVDFAPSASSGRPFILQIGEETFTGLHAEDRTAEKLTRFATRRNIESAGRKPSWDR